MTTDVLPTGPGPEAITADILERYPETDTISIPGATFFSLSEKHFPNYVTIVTTDDFDEGWPSNLSERAGVFRVNIGVGRTTFERVVGSVEPDPDYAEFDRFLPHPVYAKQLWISILNPSDATYRDQVWPLIQEAHDRLADANARHREPSTA